tara:strand:+ start:35 stop:259 length:225 start_codon:yes stop_codon:yes gene_type:complete
MLNQSTEAIVNRLVELDESLNAIKSTKKGIDEEIKNLEEELINISESNNVAMDTLTGGKYHVKPNTGRKLKIRK